MEIKWNTGDLTPFIGRNGIFKCRGVWIGRYIDRVTIEPITSKGEIGHCRITLPKEKAAAVCSEILYGEDAAQQDLLGLVLEHIDQKELPALLGLNKALDEIIAKRLEQ